MDMTLVVMAAGLGSRYGGVKQIERLGPDGEILMEYAIYDALRAGFDRIVLIIKPQMLQDVRALFGDRIARAPASGSTTHSRRPTASPRRARSWRSAKSRSARCMPCCARAM